MVGAVVLVPAVIAAERPDDRADRTSVGTLVAEEDAWAPLGTADTVEARIRSGLDATGSALLVVRPDDRAGMIGVGAVGQGAPASRPTTSPGADPVDPYLVLGVGLAIALLSVAAFVLVENGRRGADHGRRGGPGMPAASH